MKKSFLGFLLPFFCLTAYSTTIVAAELSRLSFWPGYLDTSNCEPFKDCQKDVLMNVFKRNKHSQFFILNSSSYTSSKLRNYWQPQWGTELGKQPWKVTLNIGLRLYDHYPQGNKGTSGIKLRSSQMPGSPESVYRLKAFHSGVRGVFHLCEIEIKNYKGVCKEGGQTKEVSLEWTQEELFNNAVKQITVDLNTSAKFGLDYADFQVKATTIALGLDAFPTGRERRLIFPGIKMETAPEVWTKDGTKVINFSGGTVDWLIESKMVRLNQRKCYLDASTNVVNFTPDINSPLSITSAQNGKVNKFDIPTAFTLRCDGQYSEPLYTGGQKNWDHLDGQIDIIPKDGILVKGTRAIHTVQNVKIQVDQNQIIKVGTHDKIGLHLPGKTPSSFYVEGSYTPNLECGRDVLPINSDFKSSFGFTEFQREGTDSNLPSDAIGPRSFNKIHWRLCKTPGDFESGEYSGTAKVIVEYK